MIRQTPGKIFLADQRGRLETPQFRRDAILSFGSYADAHKGPVGRLHACNEETLAGAHHQEFTPTRAGHVVLLPVTGDVQVSVDAGPAILVPVEEVRVLSLPAGATLRFTNPYEEELISFVHLWLDADEQLAAPGAHCLRFTLAALENRLAELTAGVPELPFALHLGRFQGRHEVEFSLQPGRRFFAFVLAGAFEVEGRLLHEKDALALWKTETVEIEALSNHALLLVLAV